MRILSCALAFAASFWFTSTTYAQNFPDGQVTIVVGYSAGGSNDLMGRNIGQELGKIWGQNVVIENRPGAAGAIAAAHVSKTAPDGRTLMVGPVTLTMTPAVQTNLPYDLFEDFEPVALIGRVPVVLVVSPASNIGTLNEFVTKAKGGGLFSGTTGPGSLDHFATELFKKGAGVDIDIVHFKGGTEAVVDLIGGRTHMYFGSVTQVAQQVRDGQLKALAVSGSQRSAALPDVPTFAEQGISGVDVQQWWGIFAPKGTPADIVNRINADIRKGLASEASTAMFRRDGVIAGDMDAKAFGDFVRSEFETWQRTAKEANITVK